MVQMLVKENLWLQLYQKVMMTLYGLTLTLTLYNYILFTRL